MCLKKAFFAGFLAMQWLVLGSASPARSAEPLRPGKVQVMGKNIKKRLKEGKRSYRYFVLRHGARLRIRAGGPAALLLLARGDKKCKATVLFVGDDGREGEVTIELTDRFSKSIFFELPPGTHTVNVTSSVDIAARPVHVRRRPRADEPVVAWKTSAGKENTEDAKVVLALVTLPAPGPAAKPAPEPEAKPAPEPEAAPAPESSTEPETPAVAESPVSEDSAAGEPGDTETLRLREGRKAPYLGIGLLVDLLITSGKPASTSLSAGELLPSGSQGLAVPVLLSVKGYIPLGNMLTISPGLEIGWFRLSGDGKRELPSDPDFGTFGYSWKIDSLPLFAGASLTVRPLVDLPLFISAGGGFSAVHVWSQSTYTKEGQPSVSDSMQSGWGTGYYLGVEGAYGLGPGRITLEYRYSSARTDLDFKDIYGNTYNRELGDLEGSNIMLGYRLDIPW
ncbi:MAG TPA: hypothetical protein VM425_08800 [Myxococcota bacterium]|nr:hypothetical protein [Myxococcota bacterium]